ncbi:hypothetical protein GGX14DRAFT_576784 [Mycena pura]|uniref:Uncharacterized protein n=1 Tax=Mycena pura TaxID=153505 RepID=A0AAD6USY5_9AGAR|nr:hypothetical protein GGX14DRAFT_576784 [Mycena pura]
MRPDPPLFTYCRSRTTPLRFSPIRLLALYPSQTPLARTFSNSTCAMPPRSNLRSLALYAARALLPQTFSSGTSPLPRLDPPDLNQQLRVVSQVYAVRNALTARADHQTPISCQTTPMQARTFGQHPTH